MNIGRGRLHTISIAPDCESGLEINSPPVGTNSYFSLKTVPGYVNQKVLRHLRLWRRKNLDTRRIIGAIPLFYISWERGWKVELGSEEPGRERKRDSTRFGQVPDFSGGAEGSRTPDLL